MFVSEVSIFILANTPREGTETCGVGDTPPGFPKGLIRLNPREGFHCDVSKATESAGIPCNESSFHEKGL